VALSFACGCSHVESGQAPSLAASKTYTEADVSKALRDAEQFATEGKNEQALERHIWYHENALKYDPAQYGVRLSFALSSWVQLGKAYPKALEALRSTRDQALAAYRKSPADCLMFGEVLSLDLAIDDLPSAKELFYEGRQHKVTDSLLMLQLDRILATSDLKWANDVIGDPQEKLEEIKRQREMAELSLTDVKDPNQVKQSLDGVFSTQIATLLRAVERIHGRPAAEKIQKAALKFLDSTEVRNALKG
jgi:hypothetical protein